MIKKKEITAERVEEVVDDVWCNMCTKSLKSDGQPAGSTGRGCYDGLVEVSTCHGLGSKFVGDTYTFSICEDCIFKLFTVFAIKPEHWSPW